ncbi:MAG: lipoyl(octanoyl) transferase LipB [Candidatus Mycalebacterium zealandia]|nr:MAG: lipoyl(octanoyl) transferase LipB [Candidatus Mycalebacterium zealandia]
MQKLKLQKPGIVDYPGAVEIQKQILEKRIADKTGDTLILLQHPPTITTGRRGNLSNLMASPEFLEKKGVYVDASAGRGGDITFHGPGQIVGYPIIGIKGRKGGVPGYVRSLEEVIIRALGDFDISARRVEKLTGVWVKRSKIASIGVGVRRWVTWHGFALNVNTDLSWFDTIVPCGIPQVKMTSIKDWTKTPDDIDTELVCDSLVKHFADVFGYEGF